jgi:hypothetical protein
MERNTMQANKQFSPKAWGVLYKDMTQEKFAEWEKLPYGKVTELIKYRIKASGVKKGAPMRTWAVKVRANYYGSATGEIRVIAATAQAARELALYETCKASSVIPLSATTYYTTPSSWSAVEAVVVND